MYSCCFCHLFQRIGFRETQHKCNERWWSGQDLAEGVSPLKGEASHRGADGRTERDVAAVRPSVTTGEEGIMSCSKVLHHRGEGSELEAIISQTSGELPEASPSHMSECSRVLGECVAPRPPRRPLQLFPFISSVAAFRWWMVKRGGPARGACRAGARCDDGCWGADVRRHRARWKRWIRSSFGNGSEESQQQSLLPSERFQTI